MTRRRRCTVLVALMLGAATPLAAQQTTQTPVDRARAFIADTMKKLGAPGAQVTVMRGGKVVWSEGFGMADLEQQVPVTQLTRFRIGSVSKSLTSVLLGRLVENRKLDLDAPVQRYVPDFPNRRWPVSARQLAGHLAGIRHYDDPGEMIVPRPYRSVRAGLEIFRDDSLRFQPGTRFAYSSYGWNLLSAVLEGAGGEPFLTQMQRDVIDAAELRHTVADFVDSIIPGRARWYTRSDGVAGRVANAPYTDNSHKWAGGGFLSTTDDLAHLADALLHGRLLKPETVQLLWTSQRTVDGQETGYGYGWTVNHDAAGRRRVYHSGGSVGGTAFLLIYPDQDLIVALLVNSDRTFVGATPAIAEMFLGSP